MASEGHAPLLSIVIPTRNRLGYLQFALRSGLSIPSSALELVVEDNSDSNDVDSWIAANVSDDRLSYRHSGQPVDMTQNYERAMARARGEYVCLIGDDDGVNPEIADAALWAQAQQIDALIPKNSAHFVWPDLQLRPGAIRPGELRIRPFNGRITWVDPEAELHKCVRDAGQNFYGLPKSYYGIVRRACLLQVKDTTGAFFPGVSPDMAAAVATANFVKKTCEIDYPLFLPGSSFKSNAGISGLNKHIGRLQDQPHLPADCLKTWSKIVPAFYSVQTIWAESVVSALTATGRHDVLHEFNVPRLYADCLFFHRNYASYMIKSFYPALHYARQSAIPGTVQLADRYLYMWGLRVRSLLRRLMTKPAAAYVTYNESGLANIDEAVRALSNFLRKSGRKFGPVA